MGWSTGERMTRELAINALLMAVWRRKPTAEVMVHSDQRSQYSSHDWQDFLKARRLQPSMSRRGNCHDNAVAESFFQLLSASTSAARSTPRALRHARTCSITSKCSTTRSATWIHQPAIPGRVRTAAFFEQQIRLENPGRFTIWDQCSAKNQRFQNSSWGSAFNC